MEKKMKCVLCRIHEAAGEALEYRDDLSQTVDSLKRIRKMAALALLGSLLDEDVCCERFGSGD